MDYPSPEWQKSLKSVGQSPYLYEKGSSLQVAKVIWQINIPIINTDKYYAEGVVTGAGGFTATIPEAECTILGDTIFLENVTADTAFANTTQYYNPLRVAWKVKRVRSGITSNFPNTNSDNVIYVSLSSPLSELFRYRTIVHLACSNSGATDSDSATIKTWALLSGPTNFKAWNSASQDWSRSLYYYKAGITGSLCSLTAPALLSNVTNNSGQCTAWAELMGYALMLNGVTTFRIKTVVDSNLNYGGFMVKDWTGNPGKTPPYIMHYDGSMVPLPPGSNFGEVTSGAGLPGQGSAPPSEKIFGNHVFLSVEIAGTDVYYDPSYGGTYTNEADFQSKAVFGFYKYLGYGNSYLIDLPTATTFMQFNVEQW